MTELPTTFGKYFLTEKLATGGMAEIYLGKLVGPGGFEKPLVIKKIHPRLSGQRHFVDLFVTEAKTLVSLAHGNIVPVYELGVIDDTYFLAMDYIDGPTLYRLTEALARREVRMEPALAAWITARILEGLDYAHRKGEGVIHRDLSPRNVMLSRDGEVKLVDFGIAVTLGASDDGGGAQSAPTGSFPYMSPEQVRREPLTGQTDLFSVGVLMWEMLVGRRLFARADAEATLAAVVDLEIPVPSSQCADIPTKLDEVVMHALERDTTSRWASAGEMLAQLHRYLYGLDTTPGPREVAALVAKYCPAETRRLPTHADAAVAADEPPAAGGPSTAVIPRDGAEPRGKPRARTETFATNVALRDLLDRATPLFPISAIVDDPAEPATQVSEAPEADDAPATPATSRRLRSVRPDSVPIDDETPRVAAAAPPPPASRALLAVAALGTLALGGVAVAMFLRGGGGGAPYDAAAVPIGPADARVALAIDAIAAPTPDAPEAPLDAPEPPADAPPAELRDAGPRLRPDAGDRAVPADAARPTTLAGEATIKIGAEPWGEVYVDGVLRSRQTPVELVLPAGRHVVEVIFKGEDPPRKKSFSLDVVANKPEQLHADFTRP